MRERSHVFVVRDGLILALQQAGSWRWWEFPGGDVEPGEDPAAAAVRETYEETGLRIAAPALLRTWSYRDRRDDEVRSHAYAALAPDGDVHLSAEHTAFAWMTVDEYEERYCGAKLAPAAPPFARKFFAGMRENCALFRAWLARAR
jgi:8-oxo-dGTP pyrophosphatase MutT (NUDIX family)